MRIGFSDTRNFDHLLDLVNEHRVDLLSVHGRTVHEMYRSEVHYDFIARAVARVRCPVLANGNVTSAARATAILTGTKAAGVMVGRHARVVLADVREYVDRLYRATQKSDFPERAHVNKMKKYLNFVGQSVDGNGAFLHEMRRAETESDLFAVCDRHLLSCPSQEFSPEPYPGVIARPNCETPGAAADSCSLESITA
jgi:tRNA-dihydrouridine synthase